MLNSLLSCGRRRYTSLRRIWRSSGHGNAVGAETLDVESHSLYIRPVFAAGIAQGGYFIYINA